MKCQKCGVDSFSDVECSKCGVVFAKYSATSAPSPSIVHRAPKPRNHRVKLLSFGLISVAAFGLYKMQASEVPPQLQIDPQSSSTLSQRDTMKASVSRQRSKIASASHRSLPRLQTYSGWKEGAKAYRDALLTQEKTLSPILLYVGVDWCGYCKKFQSSVLPVREVRDALETAIKVKINPEKSTAAKKLANQMGVTGYPSLFLIAAPKSKSVRLNTGVGGRKGPKPEHLVSSYEQQVKNKWHRSAYDAVKTKRFEHAITLLDRCLAFDKQDSGGTLYNLRAVAFYGLGQRSDAMRDEAKACELGHQQACARVGQRGR